MRLINFIRRMCIGFVIWSIEQHIEDLTQVMRETNSIHHYRSAMIEREQAKRDLAKARKEYGACCPLACAGLGKLHNRFIHLNRRQSRGRQDAT